MLEQSGAHTQRGLLLLFILHLFPGPQSTLSQVSEIKKKGLCYVVQVTLFGLARKKGGGGCISDMKLHTRVIILRASGCVNQVTARLLLKEMTVYCVKTKGNECTSTFARYAIGGSAIEDHPPKERAVGDVLLGPGRPQSSTPTALLPAHPGHVEHLAPPVLPLLQPAVPSCRHKKGSSIVAC